MATTKRDSLDAFLAEADDLLAEVEKGAVEDEVGANELFGKIWGRIPKETDLVLELRLAPGFGGHQFIALVDFEPSTGRRSEPMLIERQLLKRVINELRQLDRYLGGGWCS